MRCCSSDLSILRSSQPLFDLITLDFCAGGRTIFSTLAMASIPQGAFASFKVKANSSQKGKWEKDTDKPKDTFSFPQFNPELLGIPPAKYNGKLMNSIWGQYNRYSVHNFKQIKGDVLGRRQQLPQIDEMIVKSVSACITNPTFFVNKSG